MPQVYSNIDFSLWPVFNNQVDKSLQNQIVLVHIFGHEGSSAIFVTQDGTVYAVGSNDEGRLGIGDIPRTITPVEISFLADKEVKCFASGSIHTIALSKKGALYSWGNNTLGRLGNGTYIDRDSPGRVLLADGVQVTSICCGERYSLALTIDNRVLHWGDIQFSNCAGQNIPCELRFPNGTLICDIACGGFHAAALTTSGSVFTWGVNSNGQLGRGHHFDLDPTPSLIDRSSPALAIGCGLLTTIVLNVNKRLESWGHNRNLQEFECGPISEFAIANMGEIICMKCRDEFYRYNFENEYDAFGNKLFTEDNGPKRIDVRNMQSAFEKRVSPQFLRANPLDLAQDMSVIEPIQGQIRDIAQALFDRKEHSDLTLKLSDGEVYVHKLILITFCEHFKTMLVGSWGSEAKNEMDMQSYNPKAYRGFLKYVYSGRLDPLYGPELIDLYKIAQAYFENDLKSMVITMFQKRLMPENIASLYALAHKGFCEELIEHCFEFASCYIDEIILSEGFDKLSPELSKTLVKEATKRKKKNI